MQFVKANRQASTKQTLTECHLLRHHISEFVLNGLHWVKTMSRSYISLFEKCGSHKKSVTTQNDFLVLLLNPSVRMYRQVTACSKAKRK